MNKDLKITFEKFRDSDTYKNFEKDYNYYKEWVNLEELIREEKSQKYKDIFLIKTTHEKINEFQNDVKASIHEYRYRLEEIKHLLWKLFIELFSEKFYEIGFRSKHCIDILFQPDKCTFENLETLILKYTESSANQTENLISF